MTPRQYFRTVIGSLIAAVVCKLLLDLNAYGAAHLYSLEGFFIWVRHFGVLTVLMSVSPQTQRFTLLFLVTAFLAFPMGMAH